MSCQIDTKTCDNVKVSTHYLHVMKTNQTIFLLTQLGRLATIIIKRIKIYSRCNLRVVYKLMFLKNIYFKDYFDRFL